MLSGLAAGAAAQVAAPQVAAPQVAAPEAAEPVVVSATRTPLPAFDVPASISAVDGDTVRDERLGVNFSESVGAIPGLAARDRQNYAQDEQVEIRGFGARSSFGLRGIRVYVDGIPSTLPDGQGWVSNFDLGSVDWIEVLRGPYSALYGNSSGGVIQAFTRPGGGPATITPGFAAGSNGEVRESVQTAGTTGPVGYDLDLTHFQTDGYRAHSAAVRDFANARFDLAPDAASHLMLALNSVASPTAQDPLGATRKEFAANPRAVDPAAVEFNTRKTFDQTQVGLVYDRRIGDADEVELKVYDGHRNASQFQAIPVATQKAKTSPGGVIDLGRDYEGSDVHWTRHTELASGPLTLTAGLAYDALQEARTGYLDYIGTDLGVAGALRRDQANSVFAFDQYAQALWQFLPAWTASAGLRHTRVPFNSTDAAIKGAGNGDNESATYAATLPVGGLEYAASDTVHVYFNAGRGFETPTLNELAYRPNGLPGLNFGLQPDHSDNAELGVKVRSDTLGQIEAALFLIDTRDEIVTQSNSGGRSVYQNAGTTRREGVELSWQKNLLEHLRLQAAYTLLDAAYTQAFLTCTVTPCVKPDELVASGNRIPAIARSSLYLDASWRPPTGWQAGVEVRAASALYVDDINSQTAAGYAIAGVRGGYRILWGRWDVSGFVRVDNVFNRQYAGSVIVDETSSRFFEAAPGRTVLGGASGTFHF
jgi:iron complex outermembrane receptor protein